MKKAVFILMLILFIVIDVYTLWLMSPDFLFPKRSIYVTNQDDYIVESVKEYFHIEYDVSKIVYQQGFPDGYFWIYMTQLERNTKNLMTHLMLLKVIKYNNFF